LENWYKVEGKRSGVILCGPNGEGYELTTFLGAGSFGEVYRAENKKKEIILAAKVLPLEGISDKDLILSLMNEAELATKIKHSNVVNVFFAGKDKVIGPYLLMEYISGDTLKEYLLTRIKANSMISLRKSREMMMQIAQGARAINQKLVHRDLKPDNILISDDQLKITDFGLSKLVAERTRTTTFKGIGAICYMAPEAWQLKHNTLKIDIYSVGLIFYEILTLSHPLQSKVTDPSHVEAWRRVHLFQKIEDARSLRSDIPRHLAQLLSRMVAKNTDDRPEWDEIISVLSSDNVESEKNNNMAQIIERAIERRNETEEKRLKEDEERSEEEEREQLYRVSFEQLISSWDNIIDSFNIEFQGKSIKKILLSDSSIEYMLPNAPSIDIVLFSRRDTDINILNGKLMGGGIIGIKGGISVNILLIKKSQEDIYGQWVICFVKINPLYPKQELASALSNPPHVEPFGFSSESDFYEHIAYAGGGGSSGFIYELKTDLEQVFKDFLDTAFSMK